MSEIVLRTVHLTERYGRLAVADDLGLEVSRGEVFGFLGLNGAGESTAIRMVLGLARRSAGHGSLLVLDEPTSGLDPLMEKEFGNVVRALQARAGRVTVLSARRPSRSERVSR
jgi:ABC-type multidrug transport system ATPase subunit